MKDKPLDNKRFSRDISPPCWWAKTKDLSLASFVRPPEVVLFFIVIGWKSPIPYSHSIFMHFTTCSLVSFVGSNIWEFQEPRSGIAESQQHRAFIGSFGRCSSNSCFDVDFTPHWTSPWRSCSLGHQAKGDRRGPGTGILQDVFTDIEFILS